MKTIFRRAGMVAALFAGALALTAPAHARDRHGDDDAAIAIGAGLVGLAIGAAIASDDRHDRYYDRRYYYDGPRYRAYPRHYYRDYPRHYYRDDRRYRDREYRRYKKHRDRYYRHYGW